MKFSSFQIASLLFTLCFGFLQQLQAKSCPFEIVNDTTVVGEAPAHSDELPLDMNVEVPDWSHHDDSVYTMPEEMASFPGGNDKLFEFIHKNLQYPEYEMTKGMYGKVFIECVIESDGSISNVKVLREVKDAPGLTKEAIRITKSFPKWHPAKHSGKNVRTKIILPFTFHLN